MFAINNHLHCLLTVNSLVQCIIGHGVFGVKGDNDGFVKRVPSAPSPFKETQYIRK